MHRFASKSTRVAAVAAITSLCVGGSGMYVMGGGGGPEKASVSGVSSPTTDASRVEAAVVAEATSAVFAPSTKDDASPITMTPGSIIPTSAINAEEALLQPSVFVFASASDSGPDTVQKVLDKVAITADRLKGTAKVYHIGDDAPKMSSNMRSWLKTDWTTPYIVVADKFLETTTRYVLGDLGDDTTPEDIEKFVKGALGGEFPPFRLSAKRTPNDRHEKCKDLYVITHDTFKPLVISNRKDFIVESYLPGCKACGALAPRLKALAVLLGETGSADVGIMDMENNDAPKKYLPEGGYPMIKMFPGKAKRKPVILDMLSEDNPGLPTVLELLEFVHKNASTSFELTEALKKRAIDMESEAKFYEGAKHRLSEAVRVWMPLREADPEKAASHKDVLMAAFHLLDNAGPGDGDAVKKALDDVDAAFEETGAYKPALGNVLRFTNEDDMLKEEMKGEPHIIFYSDARAQAMCTKMEAAFAEASRVEYGDDIVTPTFMHFDCSWNQEACKERNIIGVPTVSMTNRLEVARISWDNPELLKSSIDAFIRTLEKPSEEDLTSPPAAE